MVKTAEKIGMHEAAWPVQPRWVLSGPLGGGAGEAPVSTEALTAAPFVNQPGHETEMVQDCTPVRSVPRRLLSKGDSTHPP